jgi:hypothetical protein
MNCPNCNFDLSLTKRGKTSPENRLFHALCSKLAMWKQISPDVMKRYLKLYAASMRGYPCETFEFKGRKAVEPKSVAKASSAEMCMLIDVCYELALEWGTPLEQTEVYHVGE